MTMKTMKALTVSIPPRLFDFNVHWVIRAVNEPHSRIEVMASSLAFVTPVEMCGLRLMVECAADRADEVFFDCPSNGDVNRYLARMNFYSELPPNVVLSSVVPELRRRDRSKSLVELSRVQTRDDVEEFIRRSWEVTSAQFGVGRMAKACAVALGAASENVLEHAQSRNGALVAAQRYKNSGIELAVVDLGLGIPSTMRRVPKHSSLSDLEIVELALEDHVTSSQVAGRGAGLHELITAVERAGNATLAIQSGLAHLNVHFRDGTVEYQRLTPADEVQGTWISVRLLPQAFKP